MKKREGTSRRSMLASSVTGLSSAWLATHWPEILTAQEQARKAAGSAKFEFLSAEQAVEVEAMMGKRSRAKDRPRF